MELLIYVGAWLAVGLFFSVCALVIAEALNFCPDDEEKEMMIFAAFGWPITLPMAILLGFCYLFAKAITWLAREIAERILP